MFFTGMILPPGTNTSPEQGGAGTTAPRGRTDPAGPMRGRLAAQTFSTADDASSRIQPLSQLLREPWCRHQEKGLIRATRARGRRTQRGGFEATPGVTALRRGCGQRGQGRSCPGGSLLLPQPLPQHHALQTLLFPAPSRLLARGDLSPPCSGWALPAEGFGEIWGDFGPNTTGQTNSLTPAFCGTGSWEQALFFPV